MALYYDLPVYKDTYQLILKNFEFTKDFGREYKYTLGQALWREIVEEHCAAAISCLVVQPVCYRHSP